MDCLKIEKVRDVTQLVIVGTFIALAMSHVVTFYMLNIPSTNRILLATIMTPVIVAPLMLTVLGRSMLNEARLSRRLQAVLERDHLTDIYNRKYFFDRISDMPSGTKGSILMIDIDFFKNVNDTYGHFVGDEVIRCVAQTLAKTVRQTDFVARFGGEEFVAFLHGGNLTDAKSLAERFRCAVSVADIPTVDGAVKVTVSIGLSTIVPDTKIVDSVTQADDALLLAKKNGRNRVVIANPVLYNRADLEPALLA